VPYNDTAQALAALPAAYRAEGLVIYVRALTGLEWWQFVGGIEDINLKKVDFLGGTTGGGGTPSKFGKAGEDATATENRAFSFGSAYNMQLSGAKPNFALFTVNSTGQGSTAIAGMAIGDVARGVYGYVNGGGTAIEGYANSSEIAGTFRTGSGNALSLTQANHSGEPLIFATISGGGAVPIPAIIIRRPIDLVENGMGLSINFKLPVMWNEDEVNQFREFEIVKIIASNLDREMFTGQGQFILQVRDGGDDSTGDWTAFMRDVLKIDGKGHFDLRAGSLVNAASDAAAAGAGVPVNRLYRNGSVVMYRVS
jgi:hypothetical protein